MVDVKINTYTAHMFI